MAKTVRIIDTSRKALIQLDQELSQGLKPMTWRSGNRLAKEIKRTIQRDWTSKSGFGMGTGSLADSFKVAMTKASISNRQAIVYSTSVYAGIHQTGRVITPKNYPYLYVPLERLRALPGFTIHDHLIWKNRYLLTKATIKRKPIGASQGYLDIAIDRFRQQEASHWTDGIRRLWNSIAARFR